MDSQAEEVRNEEKLIEMVRDRPFLYNKKLSDYKDKIKKNNAWSEICAALELSDAQKLWNDLRRQYTTYLCKLAKPSGSGSGSTPTFRHSLTMSFYQGFYKPYKTSSNLNEEEGSRNDDHEDLDQLMNTTPPPGIEVNFEGFNNETPPSVQFDIAQADTTPTVSKSRFANNKKRKIVVDHVEERLLAALEKTSADPDELDHFGANIAGRLRKIQKKSSRLANRAQFSIQKVLFEIEESLHDESESD